MSVTSINTGRNASVRRGRRVGLLLLVLPYIALCFPQWYTRKTPVLWGFPFFYWYQFAWILITSIMLAVFYKISKPSKS